MTTQLPKLWVTREGSMNIKRMDTSYIYNSIRVVQTNKQPIHQGYKNEDWLTVLKDELDRRNRIFTGIMSKFPKVHNEYKSIIAEQRSFTTKHIKTC